MVYRCVGVTDHLFVTIFDGIGFLTWGVPPLFSHVTASTHFTYFTYFTLFSFVSFFSVDMGYGIWVGVGGRGGGYMCVHA